ncbi:MAG TPA: glycosyltransferase family 4 protein [Gemmatimonadales bacterium]|nr:glycosyltransferase family 4 protein [Gemmatimonadales bacterium]
MPKTFLLTDEFPPIQTGIARLMGEIARRYPRGELLVSTGQHHDALETDGRFSGVTIDRLPVATRGLRHLAGLLLWSRRVASLARQHRPRFLWCDSVRPSAYPARWTQERTGARYGILVHGGDLLKELHRVHHNPLVRRTAKVLFRSAAAVVANSQWTREQAHKVLRELGLDPLTERVKVVPLGTDPAQFRPGLDTREVRARYRLNGGPWIVTVARLEAYKGVDTGIKALARLRALGLEVQYAVVGAGKRRDAYKRLAQELGVGAQVRFLGSIPDADLPAVYNVGTVYLGASRRADGTRVEGFGVALAEASACGLPVVAGRSGGLAEAVEDGETGLVVDPEDVEAVAQALHRILTDDLLARRLGQGGRKAVESHFNWDRVIKDLREIEAQVTAA